jgi:cytochrome P450
MPPRRPEPALPRISFGAKLSAMAVSVGQAGPVDLTDLDMWARGVPYDEFARLRDRTPVAWSDEPGSGPGFWSVLRHDDIVTASRDVRTFSSARGISFEDPTDDDLAARRTIIDTDPPGHTKLRKILSGSFTQRAVAVYQQFVEALTEQVLDDGLSGEPFDFVDAVAKEVPIRVLARIMGLPAAELPLFIDLGDRLIANTDPDITDVVWGRDDTDAYRRFPFRSPYGKQLWDLGRSIIRDRLASPGEDLLSALLRAEVDGERLSETDLDNFFSIMVIAGNETTRIAIAQAVLAFCEHPGQWDRLRAGLPKLGGDGADVGHSGGASENGLEVLETATEEVLRWTCPTHFMRRTATTDTELGGTRIRAGDKVVLWYVSGNRDDKEFPDPDRFDIGRSPNRHLSFGRGGPHLCLGAHLARLEIRAVLGALARRVARFELAGPPRRIRSNFTNGLKALPIRVRPA